MRYRISLLALLGASTIASAQAPPVAEGLKVTGFLNYRYEWTENPRLTAEEVSGAYPSIVGNAQVDAKSENITQVVFLLDNKFDGRTRFHAWIQAYHLSGRTTNTYLVVPEAYVAAKFGPAEIGLGRHMVDVGLGTVGGAPFMDGISLSAGNKMVQARAYLARFGNQRDSVTSAVYSAAYGSGTGGSQNTHMTFAAADLRVTPLPGLTLGASYLGDVTTDDATNLYKSASLFAEYKYVANNIPWVTAQAEYARNTAGLAKTIRNTGWSSEMDKAPTAYFAKVKFLGAHPFMPGTGGVSLQYRKGEAGFDVMSMADPFAWNCPFNWMTPAAGGSANNHKGFELAGEVTVLPRTILKAAYGLMKTTNTGAILDLGNTQSPLYAYLYSGIYTAPKTDSQKYFTAQVFYLF